jgi:hypothetical protein
MKGGSVASSAVTGLVSPELYDSMSKNFDNNLDSSCLDGGKSRKQRAKRTSSKNSKTKKGGSDASNAVVQLVNPAAFDKLSTNFDNTIQCAGCSCGAGKTGKKCKCDCGKGGKSKCKTGGSDGIWKTVMKDISEQFAGAGLSQKAGEFDISNFKNINDYESSGVNITNKKKMGGACDSTPVNLVGLDYSGIKHNSAEGIPFDRNLSSDVLLTMTDSSINTSGISSMNKVVEYGGIETQPSNFAFAGLTGGKAKGKGKGKAKWESIGKQIKLKDGSKRTVYKNSKNGKFAIKKIVDNKASYKVIKY